MPHCVAMKNREISVFHQCSGGIFMVRLCRVVVTGNIKEKNHNFQRLARAD